VLQTITQQSILHLSYDPSLAYMLLGLIFGVEVGVVPGWAG